jgi:hypothetical protein
LKFRISNTIYQTKDIDAILDEIIIDLNQTTLNQEQYNAIFQFFDKVISNTALQDRFFENFTVICENLFFKEERWHKAEHLLKMILQPALDWDRQHPQHLIHKGTPFYFWGMAAICRGDLDTGYALMHQALEEDRRTYQTLQPLSPAFAFAILDYQNVNQAFRVWSLYQAQFLKEILGIYCSTYGKN